MLRGSILCVWAFLLCSTSTANEQGFAYLGERLGLHFGMTLEEVVSEMQSQGFAFATSVDDATEGVVVAIATPNLELIDVSIPVVEAMGSMRIWNSANVVLGFKDQQLTVIAETDRFARNEALDVFDENKALLVARHGDSAAEEAPRLPTDLYREVFGQDMRVDRTPPLAVDFWITPEIYVLAVVTTATDEHGRTDFGKAKYAIAHVMPCAYEFLKLQLDDPSVCGR